MRKKKEKHLLLENIIVYMVLFNQNLVQERREMKREKNILFTQISCCAYRLTDSAVVYEISHSKHVHDYFLTEKKNKNKN
jgi:hypothetical protein